jgi:co-chaperonin GroES (HSP10)
MNHNQLAPAHLTHSQRRKAEAAVHNLEMAKQMAKEQAETPVYHYEVEDVEPQHDCVLAEIIVDKADQSLIVRADISGEAEVDRNKARIVILAVGPGRVTEYGVKVEQKFKAGQVIIPTGGQRLPPRIDKRELYIFRPDEIMCVIKQPEQSIAAE